LVALCPKFDAENLPEKFSSEMEFCEIDHRSPCWRPSFGESRQEKLEIKGQKGQNEDARCTKMLTGYVTSREGGELLITVTSYPGANPTIDTMPRLA
jgi:hypothetical protein